MDDAAVFCMECGKPLPDKPIRTNAKTTDRKRPEHKKIYKRPSKKARRVKIRKRINRKYRKMTVTMATMMTYFPLIWIAPINHWTSS